jgi:hypothetical protein
MNWSRERQSEANAEPWCQPTDLYYIDNDILHITTTTGDDNPLYLFKLRPAAATRRVVTQCCHTPLFGQHPFYLRNRLVLYPSLAQIQFQGEPMKLHCRIQTKFWNPNELGELPALPDGVLSVPSESPMWLYQSGLLQFMVLPPPSKEGSSANVWIDRLGLWKSQPLELGNIEEQVPEGCFRTGGGVLSMTFKNPFYKRKEDTDVETNKKESGNDDPAKVVETKEEDSNVFEVQDDEPVPPKDMAVKDNTNGKETTNGALEG